MARVGTRRRWAACLGIATVLAGAVSRADPANPASPQSPAALLKMMGQAARQGNYDGVLMFHVGGRSSAVQVSHRSAGDDQYERLEPLDGPERHIYRHNDELRVLWPRQRVALIQQRSSGTAGIRPWANVDERVLDFYELAALGEQRWAGHPSVVVQLKPRDQYRHGQRLWADRQSGLVLRSDTLGPQGQVLEWSAFTQLTYHAGAQRPWPLPDARHHQGWRWIKNEVATSSLTKEGWQVTDLPPGFRLLGCVRRPMPLGGAVGEGTPAPSATSGTSVLQAVFSDGVAQVSVFIEPFDPSRHQRELLLGQGATQTLKRRSGPWWLTVVGDVPAVTVQRFAQSIQRQ